jgi:two-component system NarL family response regulator
MVLSCVRPPFPTCFIGKATNRTQAGGAAAIDGDTSKIKVMIVTDHPIMRDGLRFCLGNAPDMELVCEADNEASVLADFERCHPDVILIDLQFPAGAGVRATRAILHVAPQSAVVVLTTFSHEVDMLLEINGQNILCISKTVSSEDLVAAIRQAVVRHQG